MAMLATVTQTQPAIFGQPATFMLAVQNTGGSAVNVTSIQPQVTLPTGAPATSFNLSGPYAPPGTSVAQVGGSQFNVQVGAGSTVNFPFQVSFFGPAVAGGPGAPSPTYLVGANCAASDGSIFGPGAIQANLSRPIFGRAPGAPPNPAPAVGGQVNFSTPSNSGLAL